MILRQIVLVGVLAFVIGVLHVTLGASAPGRREPRRPVQVVRVVKDHGFSWRDAGIGAAAVGVSIAAIAGGSLVLLRGKRPRPPAT